jgi:hypothetical protein
MPIWLRQAAPLPLGSVPSTLDLAGVTVPKAFEDLDCRRLARSVGSEEGKDLTRLDGQINAGDSMRVGITLGQSSDGHSGGHAPSQLPPEVSREDRSVDTVSTDRWSRAGFPMTGQPPRAALTTSRASACTWARCSGPAERLRVDLVDVLGARRPGGEPSALGGHLETADGGTVAGRMGEARRDGLARELRRGHVCSADRAPSMAFCSRVPGASTRA